MVLGYKLVTSTDSFSLDRRTLLASVASLAGATSVSGCSYFAPEDDSATRVLADDEARELAERFAPTLFFDEHEQWYPTDPRPYVTEADGETVVDGFAALDGYTEASRESDEPPAPTLFYHGVEYVDSPLAVVQFWYYSAFDQFTTNFHWHDWEVLHVFVDTESGDSQLYVASSHSGSVPNNEFLDPDPDTETRILSELGSHSSALSVNDEIDRFQRLSLEGTFADITNSAIDGIENLADIPVAYGLPRDEGMRLPYLVPELDDAPLYDHERLPSVERDDLVSEELTVSSFTELQSPPGDLLPRETGLVFGHEDGTADADVGYDLVPSSELEDIVKFTGPQLSFEFAIPQFVEDAVSGHITTTGVPWSQPRYNAPAEDISDPNHREALASRYEAIGEPASINTIVAGVTEAVTTDDAPEDEGLTTEEPSVEAVAMVESEPEAVPTFHGTAVVQDVPEGEHRFTVNGAGIEPHSETVAVADDDALSTAAGIEGEVPVVAREHSTKLGVDAEGTDADLTRLAIEDDFAGRLYDAPLSGPDAVYVHRGGAYTTEVRDVDDEIGAFRVNPSDEKEIRIDEPRTGKGVLAEFVADLASETGAAVSAVASSSGDDTGDRGGSGSDSAVEGLARALEAVAEAARQAADQAAAGEQGQADQSLATVQDRLERVSNRLAEASGDLPADLERAIGRRFDQLDRRAAQARDAETL